jgi:RNA polymerase sigma-70 factor (ECF subfamily)
MMPDSAAVFGQGIDMSDQSTPELVARWRQGDEQAAAELFRRYTGRLVALARSRLSDKLAQRCDPEDVVQSAYRSFFAQVREGRFDFEHGGDLWNFLVAVTLHKLHKQFRRNTALKRALEREQAPSADGGAEDLLDRAFSGEPSPLEAVALVDEVQRIMGTLAPLQRRMLELRLQGYSQEEVAAQTGRSEITVRRFLKQLRQDLQRWREDVTGG